MVDGGPGGPAFHSVWSEWSPVAGSFEITEALSKEREIVVFDSRGSGLSQPSLDCHEANEDTADRTDPPSSIVPVLLVNGAYDPATPPEWSAEITESFPKATHLVFQAAGHAPSAGEACAVATAVRFLRSAGDNRAFAEPDCALYREPPDFLIR